MPNYFRLSTLVHRAYERLLSTGAILPSPALRLRLPRSVLSVLREWILSTPAQRMGTSATGASLILRGVLTSEQTASINQGAVYNNEPLDRRDYSGNVPIGSPVIYKEKGMQMSVKILQRKPSKFHFYQSTACKSSFGVGGPISQF